MSNKPDFLLVLATLFGVGVLVSNFAYGNKEMAEEEMHRPAGLILSTTLTAPDANQTIKRLDR
ncbi:MAG TPA: hypothetical protein VK099_01455 [Alcanivoracaceae bacterium]|nr:hypothetical protein [Alcanivoracaceae bacterium]